MRIPDLGYGLLTGGANYYEDDVPFREGQPLQPVPSVRNCYAGEPRDLPADGGTCFMATFPFIGTKQYGCSSMTVQGGYGGPYVQCIPPFLKDEGFISFNKPIRIGITLAMLYMVFRQ